MINMNTVFPFFFFLIIPIIKGALEEQNAFYALFGLQIKPYATAYLFDNFLRAKVRFNIEIERFEAPAPLN